METLSDKFNNLITQYKNTYQDFVNTISSNDNSFVTIPNSAFVGGENVDTLQNSSTTSCTASCSSNPSCAGATFDQNSNSCSLVGNSGNIVSSNDQTAIVKQALYYSYQLKQINEELRNTNNSMMEINDGNTNEYQQTQEQNAKKYAILQNNYNTLENERYQIEQLIREYETINSAQESGQINTSSNFYTYLFYLIIAIFLVMMLLKLSIPSGIQMGGGSKSIINPLIFIFLALVIIGNAYIKSTNIF